MTVGQFFDLWNNPATIAATAAEFTQVRALGVTSFPQLLLEIDGSVIKLSPGYAKVDQLDAALSGAMSAVVGL